VFFNHREDVCYAAMTDISYSMHGKAVNVAIGQVSYQHHMDFRNVVSTMDEEPYDVLLITGTDEIDAIMQKCGENARIKILMIEASDD